MEVFASGGRTRAVRVLVCILCALFIFAVVAAPPAHAVALESVALFGLAAVLSSATAALGYKLSNSSQGKATLSRMCSDFANDAVMGAKVLVGMKIYGLQEGMKYIKMQVKNGKTYLDSKVVAWCQQYLGKHGVYADGKIQWDDMSGLKSLDLSKSRILPMSAILAYFPAECRGNFDALVAHFNINTSLPAEYTYSPSTKAASIRLLKSDCYSLSPVSSSGNDVGFFYTSAGVLAVRASCTRYTYWNAWDDPFKNEGSLRVTASVKDPYKSSGVWHGFNVGGAVIGNTTGLDGTDTIGKDYINLTLEQILAQLQNSSFTKDWYDAGVESVLDGEVSGSIDLPVTVGAGAATLNPDIAADEDLVYTPSFDLPLEDVRSGSTAATDVAAGQEQAKTQANTADVSENQSIVNDLVNWALDYISFDKGLFAKFPLCIPYDAYLLACAAGGRDAVGGASVFGASPGDLSGAMTSAQVSEQSNFVPVVHIKNDLQLSDQKVPIDIEIDLTPFSDMVAFGRAGISIVFIAGLIAAEYARIKGGKS